MTSQSRQKRTVRREGERPAPPPAPAGDAGADAGTRGAADSATWRFVLVVGATALALRLLHVWQIRRAPFFDVLMGDAQAYDAWARRLAGGDWIGTDVFYQAPLYPYFLGVVYAALGSSPMTVRIVQAVIGAAACVFAGLAARRLFSPRAGLAAGLGLAAYAPAIFFDGLIQKSVLDVAFVSLSVWLLSGLVRAPSRRTAWAALGLAMGALSLTRENALALVAVVGVWALLPVHASASAPADGRLGGIDARRIPVAVRWRNLAAFGAAVILVLAPVAIRNAAVGGGFYLTTSQFGPNLYIGNNATADGTYASLRFGRGAPEYERQDATDLAELATGRTLSPAEVSGFWTGRALAFITGSPAAWARLMARKFLLLWNASEMLDTESQETYAEWSLPLRATGGIMHFGVLVPLALLGVLVTWSDRRRLWVVYALTATYAASVLVFYVFARYRFPLVPLLIVLASGGLTRVRTWAAGAPRARRAAVAAAVGLTAVFANWPVLSADLMRAITETNLATALQAAGRMDDAEAHYRRAIALQPGYAPAYNNLGAALRAQGKVAEAVASYQRALDVSPDFPDAHYNLANALLEQQKPGDAAAHFRIALQSIPDSAGTRNNLGIALMETGDVDAALAEFEAALRAEPGSAKAMRNLASALEAKGRGSEALSYLQRAVQADPGDDAAFYDLGSALLTQGQLEPAVAALSRAVALNPRSADAHNNLGIALGSQGRIADAIAAFEQALAIEPGNADARRNLALARAQGKK